MPGHLQPVRAAPRADAGKIRFAEPRRNHRPVLRAKCVARFAAEIRPQPWFNLRAVPRPKIRRNPIVIRQPVGGARQVPKTRLVGENPGDCPAEFRPEPPEIPLVRQRQKTIHRRRVQQICAELLVCVRYFVHFRRRYPQRVPFIYIVPRDEFRVRAGHFVFARAGRPVEFVYGIPHPDRGYSITWRIPDW